MVWRAPEKEKETLTTISSHTVTPGMAGLGQISGVASMPTAGNRPASR